MIGERFVLDGCHNPHAAQQLLLNWRDLFGTEQADMIFGALSDKDYSTMLEILAPISREVLLVPVRSERGQLPRSSHPHVLCRIEFLPTRGRRWKHPTARR